MTQYPDSHPIDLVSVRRSSRRPLTALPLKAPRRPLQRRRHWPVRSSWELPRAAQDSGERLNAAAPATLLAAHPAASTNAGLAVEPAEQHSRTALASGGLTGPEVLEVLDAERRRVAYDIHDGLAQVAVGAYQQLEVLAGRLSLGTQEDQEQLARLRELMRDTIREVRHVIASLLPTVLDDFGLETALQKEVQQLRDDGWDIRFNNPGLGERLPRGLELGLFRVVQEALANARKHAGTTPIALSLTCQRSRVCLEIDDWGRGFDPAGPAPERQPGSRVGLIGMRQRVALLGGTYQVISRPGAGTRVRVEVPLDPVAEDRTKGDRDGTAG